MSGTGTGPPAPPPGRLGGLLTKVIVEALRPTGVLDQCAIVRDGSRTQALERRVAS